MTNNQMKAQETNKAGKYISTGFQPSKIQATNEYKKYCFKCGKPLSAHVGFIFSKCPTK